MPYGLHLRHVPALYPVGMHPSKSASPVHTVHAAHSRLRVVVQSVVLEAIYCPATHCVHGAHSVRKPSVAAYVPAGQSLHVPGDVPPHPYRYCPAGHGVSHTEHEVRYPVPEAYLPSGQSVHDPLLVPPQSKRYIPAGHVRLVHGRHTRLLSPPHAVSWY